jgi:hypothetical protein
MEEATFLYFNGYLKCWSLEKQSSNRSNVRDVARVTEVKTSVNTFTAIDEIFRQL